MPIKCGKGHYHDSVAEVRACYGADPQLLTRGYRLNKYAGECRKCGGHVAPNTGRIDKVDDKWLTSHIECPENPVKLDAPEFKYGRESHNKIPPGHYATKSRTGNNDYDFWRVDRPEEGPYNGRTFVKRVIGGKPDMNVSKVIRVQVFEAILEEGVELTAQRYGQELGRCSACNRHLTDETSRRLGKGPECRSKGK